MILKTKKGRSQKCQFYLIPHDGQYRLELRDPRGGLRATLDISPEELTELERLVGDQQAWARGLEQYRQAIQQTTSPDKSPGDCEHCESSEG